MQFNSVTGLPDNPLNSVKNLDINPLFLLILVGILIVFYIIFSVVSENSNNNQGSANNGSLMFLEILLWAVFIILVLLNGIAYFFNIDIITTLSDIFTSDPQLKIKTKNYLAKDPPTNSSGTNSNGTNSNGTNSNGTNSSGNEDLSKNMLTKQVFNIPGNYYTYPQAQALCKAYGTELATYPQIEEAYETGADWCNYGWSDDQLALFPTNIDTWNQLRKIPGHENACGRAGINGGYIANPNVKFGVNCYGMKPKITGTEQILMNNSNLFPQTVEELEMDKKVNNFKNKLNDILIAPFNNNNWSQS